MTRRKTKNITGLPRIEGIPFHDAWVGFVCLRCSRLVNIKIGKVLLEPKETYEDAYWKCPYCKFVHSRNAALPFPSWPEELRRSDSIKAQRFWEAFFRISTEHIESYWKQCNACGRILPFNAFSKHTGWGPLQRQMECRSCKGAINAVLNPKRTRQQLHESSIRRRIGDLLTEADNEIIDVKELFERFKHKCFKTKNPLDFNKQDTWAIDHILPSKYLYPLTKENAALLSRDSNNSKRDKWPSEFYNNHELIELAKITGADLELLSSDTPIINPRIDVNRCVDRYLSVKERSNLKKRIHELKKIISSYNLTEKLTSKNKNLLGF